MVVGTPDEIAATMVDRFDQRAADGFNVMPPTFPDGRILLSSSFPSCADEAKSDPNTLDEH